MEKLTQKSDAIIDPNMYDGFAYHVSLLRDFAPASRGGDDFLSSSGDSSNMSASGRKRLRRRTQLRRNLSFSSNHGGAGGSLHRGSLFAGIGTGAAGNVDDSNHGSVGGGSVSSFGRQPRGRQRRGTTMGFGGGKSKKQLPSSVHGGKVFAQSNSER